MLTALNQVKAIEEAYTLNEKNEFAVKLTDVMVSIEAEKKPPAACVDLEDDPGHELEASVSVMTIDEIRALIAGE
jgi:hypothetical protein